jgi:hypothetical protein
MADEFLQDRKRALENEFFARREKALIDQMRAERAQQTARQALSAASGVTDPAVLDRLAALGIEPDTVLAFRLVPLVAVAWADGRLDEQERQAILAALEKVGIASGSPAHGLVQRWLSTAPPASVLTAWTAYTAALSGQLAAAERAQLRATTLGQARAVAEAAGGILGVGKISSAEVAVLRRLEEAFGG